MIRNAIGRRAVLCALLLTGCAEAPAPESLRLCQAAPSPDGRRTLEYGFVSRPVYGRDAFVVSVCERGGACQEIYRHEDAAQFVARWRGDGRVELETTSASARTQAEAAGVTVAVTRVPRDARPQLQRSAQNPGRSVSNLIETCTARPE